MGLGTITKNAFSELKGVLNSDGTIIEGMESVAQEKASWLTSYLNIPVSFDDQGHVTMDGVSFDSKEEFDTAYTEKAEKSTVTEYFDDHKYYCGCIDNTVSSLETFVKAFVAAPHAASPKFQAESQDAYIIQAGTCVLRVERSIDGAPASLQLLKPDGVVATEFLSVPVDDASMGLYINYFIQKGTTGDCYLKCFRSNTAQIPAIEDAEEFYKDIHMNVYTITQNDLSQPAVIAHNSTNNGGFALVEMENQVNEGESLIMPVIFTEFGSPLLVGVESELETAHLANDIPQNSNPAFYRHITNDPNFICIPAPIYSPLSGGYASSKSFWGMVSPKNGYYELTMSTRLGATYIYDHGFILSSQ